jgi:hypothetical protein
LAKAIGPKVIENPTPLAEHIQFSTAFIGKKIQGDEGYYSKWYNVFVFSIFKEI